MAKRGYKPLKEPKDPARTAEMFRLYRENKNYAKTAREFNITLDGVKYHILRWAKWAKENL